MFKGMGGLGDMAKMMKTAQDMQEKMQRLQEDLENTVVEGQSGAGLVRVSVTAKGEIRALSIDPSILVASEKEVVEDLILAAIRDGQSRAAERSAQETRRMADGLGLPPDFKLPF
ncbi:YbaB/EbfC family nucleoid-associated protein [Ketogulonicigenium vulgare]|uniref:Nucleoid-associated protein KVU_0418 n=1 Tax=Ketogulonicigenium vulgare (strain WSH-001) TaxID=759362 RepID=F9YA84_KETVW|nr:YbaB/EbfC family nucleoid-associated protein [Ketogulonicigenium vulgare]ADO42038.1 conserved hypothetical protein [Ketogulonicigenium vulgare Y25]AEM40257.1 30S ribosomal protein S21 [Ketogulonicigenium vulgare WSH-001]ALJ80457.1 30S ribosomal protein S21 [Ketogulonicigenium vulgare]ANW33285.1 30S ribosomal protein S21 [Ketogulonicigenium vulgare]AOZ53964.1 hypothetical protein KVC_0947 [Ketogulonicigenium vulgare]